MAETVDFTIIILHCGKELASRGKYSVCGERFPMEKNPIMCPGKSHAGAKLIVSF